MRQAIALVLVWGVALAAVGGLVLLVYQVQVQRSAPIVRDDGIPVAQPRRLPWARWTVTGSLSAHHVLIVDIETEYLHEAMAIARQVADPVKFRYAEVLIYFHRPGRPDLLPPRRVQWTPEGDYVETIYESGER